MTLRREGAGEPSDSRLLAPEFFAKSALELAPDLLGMFLVRVTDRGITSGRIVETEAYPGPEDPASHAARRIGRTRRNDPLFGPPGTAYIHCNYGVHWCFNVVAARTGKPEGVLVRAVEPVLGVELMRVRRGRDELTNGPGRLGEAFALGPELNGLSLNRPPIWLEVGDPVPPGDRRCTPRIGITRAAARPWRWYDSRSQWVSRR
ncbi:MAG: DNA-3-methyladenine glycosylase [Gemmatimonadota bacterium]